MLENQEQEQTQRPFQMRQQNVNKLLESQLDLLESLRRNKYDMCAIQEPYVDFNGKTHANRNWITIYPNMHQDHLDRTRSVILVNANLLTDTWK
ncbi:hypothetical protein L208DRAFT_1514206 [Tricholoma matsutake]|nr:hypothetical protein L208DRAFT_1514206 [Tricholoma matsutake 945]